MTAAHDRFFESVYDVVRQIPRGRVATYGQLALLLGRERGARAVGWALRAFDGEHGRRLPWHRVVGAGGRISLGERPAGLEQRRRLRAEGVRFTGGRVDLERYGLALEAPCGPVRPPKRAARDYDRETRGRRRCSRAR